MARDAWYIAFCSMHVEPRSDIFDVEQILVTGRWRDGHVASSVDIHGVRQIRGRRGRPR